ncbi:MAG: glutamate--cysteine ligase [Gammaproteobacteria bacterium]|nr:MAG: glutamate--cysteine ligase [Gammaproteobacteria bacterium]
MGQLIQKTNFSEKDFIAFQNKLHHCLEALEQLLERPGFGRGDPSIGAELELYLLDGNGRPVPENLAVKEAYDDPTVTLELNRYNLELNFSPLVGSGTPFSALQQQILDNLSGLNLEMAPWQGQVLPIGILPTLRERDFGPQVMTDLPRYRVLADAVQARRNSSGICIEGQDSMHLVHDDVTLEGACTSFQVHYRPSGQDLVNLWNATQLITPLMVGVAANSPLLLGHRLWHETRVPLFCQSIDGLNSNADHQLPPPRVSFGQGWLRHSPIELFRETVQLYPPLIPILSDEDPLAVVARGGVPKLEELCLHDGTIWSWNRPVYDAGNDPHLRIEMRVLPAGPSAADMAANAALFIGLAQGLADDVEPLLSALPFSYARTNFYRAAQYGVEAAVYWPNAHQNSLEEQSLAVVLEQLLPTAAKGLRQVGVHEEEIEYWLSLIGKRLQSRQTGASWQLQQYNRLVARGHSVEEVCDQILQGYCHYSNANTPVAEWPDL